MAFEAYGVHNTAAPSPWCFCVAMALKLCKGTASIVESWRICRRMLLIFLRQAALPSTSLWPKALARSACVAAVAVEERGVGWEQSDRDAPIPAGRIRPPQLTMPGPRLHTQEERIKLKQKKHEALQQGLCIDFVQVTPSAERHVRQKHPPLFNGKRVPANCLAWQPNSASAFLRVGVSGSWAKVPISNGCSEELLLLARQRACGLCHLRRDRSVKKGRAIQRGGSGAAGVRCPVAPRPRFARPFPFCLGVTKLARISELAP